MNAYQYGFYAARQRKQRAQRARRNIYIAGFSYCLLLIAGVYASIYLIALGVGAI